MATISNRSRYFVSVAKRDDFYREFSYSALAKANSYLAELRQLGYRSARLGQHTNKIQVRVRHKGYPDQILTVASPEAAEQLLLRIQSEWSVCRAVDSAPHFCRAAVCNLDGLIPQDLAASLDRWCK